MVKRKIKQLATAFLISALTLQMGVTAPLTTMAGPASAPLTMSYGVAETDVDFDVRAFDVPDSAGVMVVVEGTGGSSCRVYAYKKVNHAWERAFAVDGYLGKNGINYNRVVGDKTTPAGLFRMNTPFGQKEAKEGFPKEYIKVNENHVWSDSTNRMTTDSTKRIPGEYVGTSDYEVVYNYGIDMGYNRKAIYNKGSALFLHCKAYEATGSSGCVAVPEDAMVEILKLCGTYGVENSYIAIAPMGCFGGIYTAFGVNNGLSPKRR